MLVAIETPTTAQPVKALIQCCPHAVLHVADPLYSGTELLKEGSPIFGLCLAEQSKMHRLLMMMQMLLMLMLCVLFLMGGW